MENNECLFCSIDNDRITESNHLAYVIKKMALEALIEGFVKGQG